jgi:SAM-dependent methyltransferase
VDEYLRTNRQYVDLIVDIHAKSRCYDVDAFKGGACTLTRLDLQEVGDVTGKSLLHLQCHFGLDTISWARRGAKVTGVDFSEKAICLARALAAELAIPAEFICCDIYDLPSHLPAQFDIVFTSIGVLCWLPDLRRWGQVIARFLKPGGFFYIFDGHPFLQMLECPAPEAPPTIGKPYFAGPEPERGDDAESWDETRTKVHHTEYNWWHSLGEVINSLIEAGLRLEYLHEFGDIGAQLLPCLTQGSDGRWRYDAVPGSIPMTFSIKATKP